MMTTVETNRSDASLVAESLRGNRDAFGEIVTRYQTLICSLAYSGTGDLSHSQDLAQETFVAAWKQLRSLREPEKLRSWLCSIARNRLYDALKRQGREPSHAAENLEAIVETPCVEPQPPDFVISNEEAGLLWRSLERIPEIYREPLVLFYREQQSIEKVAAALDLTEDAVKQRLSRGRKLLQDQVLGFVEGALTRTRPEKAFTLAVLASLPALSFSAKAAAAGVAVANSGAAAKATGSLSLWGLASALLTAIIPNYIAYRVTLASAQSDEERRGVKMLFGKVAIITAAVYVPLLAAILWLSRNEVDRSYLPGLLTATLVLVFVPTMLFFALTSAKQGREYYARILERDHGGVLPLPAWEYRSNACLLGLPLVHVRIGDRFAVLAPPVKAWIAVGHFAIGGLFAFGGAAIAPVSLGGLAVGVLPLGGIAFGGIALGAIAIGICPIFGGLIIGWQAFNGCFAIGWKAAVGLFAVAHDFALGRFVMAAQANTEAARLVIFPNPLFRIAEFISRYWQWLNVLWIVPFFIMWRLARKQHRQGNNS